MSLNETFGMPLEALKLFFLYLACAGRERIQVSLCLQHSEQHVGMLISTSSQGSLKDRPECELGLTLEYSRSCANGLRAAGHEAGVTKCRDLLWNYPGTVELGRTDPGVSFPCARKHIMHIDRGNLTRLTKSWLSCPRSPLRRGTDRAKLFTSCDQSHVRDVAWERVAGWTGLRDLKSPALTCEQGCCSQS